MGALSSLEVGLLVIAIAGYFAATLGLWAGLLLKSADASSARAVVWARGTLLGAVVLHALALVGQGSTLLSVRAGVVGLFGWVIAVGALLLPLAWRARPEPHLQLAPDLALSGVGAQGGSGGAGMRPTRSLPGVSVGAFGVPIALVAAVYSLLVTGLHQTATDAHQLEVPFWVLHVVTIVGAYVALTWAFAASLVYLLEEWLLKHKRLPALWEKLPPLRVADEWIYRATLFGAGLLTLGIATGAAWYAARAPRIAPLHDPKVIVSLLMWGVFGMALGARWLGWRGRRLHFVVVCGFALLTISFLGTPHWLNGR